MATLGKVESRQAGVEMRRPWKQQERMVAQRVVAAKQSQPDYGHGTDSNWVMDYM